MALTNDQITAQNFKDFYGQIRPYLNGQVPTFANQFSRSDLYSTSEKIIGSYTDGKPLYQKTIECEALPNNTTKSVAHGVSNLDKIVDIKGCAYRSSDGLFITLPRVATSTTYMCEINVKSGNVNITSSTDLSAFGWSYVTIQYTKSTDSAIKVGTGTDYSTDEQIIGTWLDGKPLYQKSGTYTFTESKTDTTVNMPITLTNIKDVIEASASIGGAVIPIGSTGAYGVITLGTVTSTYVQLRLCGNQSLGSGDTVLFTVRYTKTTD